MPRAATAGSAHPHDRRRLHRTEHPGIYERGGKYVLIWRHQGHQHKKTHATLDEALAAQARNRDETTRPGGSHSLQLRNYARDWIETYAGYTDRGLADSTRNDYRYSLETRILPRLGHHHLDTIRARDIRGLVRDMEHEGLRPSSINKHLAPLKRLYITAVADRDATHNPARHVFASDRNRHPDDTLPKALTPDQARHLIEQLDRPWDLMAEFLIHTGLRISEAIALTWNDLDLNTHTPRVHITRQYFQGRLTQPKTRNSVRTIPLSRAMTTRLRDLRDDRGGAPTDIVFPNSAGAHIDPHNLRTRIIRPAAQAAGLPRVTPHMFRHTCASLLFEQGRNIKQVQAWLGHHDASTTLRVYVHLVDRGLGSADMFDQLNLREA